MNSGRNDRYVNDGGGDPQAPYRDWPQIRQAMAQLQSAGARPITGVRARSGEPVEGLAWGPPDAPRVSVVLGTLHAMEWIGTEVAMGLAARLGEHPPRDRQIWMWPVVNVDGMALVAADRAAGRRRFRRANAAGVDLNRNWPTAWKTTRIWPRLFPWLGGAGTHARSEPEVDGICTLLDAHLAQGGSIDRALSLHSFGRVLLLPWGHRLSRPPEWTALATLGRSVQGGIPLPYKLRQVARWVPMLSFAPGMEIDDLHHRYGAAALLVECSRGGLAVGRPRTWISPFDWFNPPDPRAEVAALVPPLLDHLRGEAVGTSPPWPSRGLNNRWSPTRPPGPRRRHPRPPKTRTG